jgi:signal transduction histidine kinase
MSFPDRVTRPALGNGRAGRLPRSPRSSLALAAVPALGALSLAVVILLTTRAQLVDRAISTASQHATVMASHAEQNFNAVHVLLEVLATDLHGHDLHAISEDAGREMLRTRMSGALAQVRNMSIFDAEGAQLFLSTEPIGGLINVADRDYYRQLKGGATNAASGPYIGRNTNLPTFALAHRIDDDRGEMSGLAHAAIRPDFLEPFCLAVRPAAELQTALVSDSGQVVATCDRGNPFVTRKVEDLPQFQPADLLWAGLPGVRVERRLDRYPLRVVVSLSGRGIAHAWRWELLSACLSAGLVLAISAVVIVTVFGYYRRSYARTGRELGLLERRVAERTRELQEAKQVAERANLAKSRFLAAASHDLRQPFQAMTLYKDVLDAKLTDPGQRRVLAALASSMEAGQDLLNALLDISTLEAGVTTPQVTFCNLGEILQSVAAEFIEQATKVGLQFTVVPSSAIVATDPVLFRRMIRNLLVNALKYTTRGRVLLGVRRQGGGVVRVEVWDTGPGIPADKEADIWEEFVQLHNPERDRQNGLGLGLAIVARTGRLLNHPVGLESWPGRGSVFRLWCGGPRTALPRGPSEFHI